METLSTLDAEFLHIEDGIAHMHIAGVCVFAGPPPEMGELAGLVEGKPSANPASATRSIRPRTARVKDLSGQVFRMGSSGCASQ